MHTNNGQLYALSYRLRSARNKKRSQKKDVEKRLIQLHKQEVKLWTDRRKLPWVLLAEPYQKGWKRFFVLREDVKRTNNAGFYESLLEKINTIQYSKDKGFKVKKRRMRKRVYEVKKQSLREFYEWEWNSPRLQLTENEKAFFYRQETLCSKGKYTCVKYVYAEPWRFVLQIRPHMITHMKMIDEDLEREVQQLKNYVERNYLRHKIIKMTKGRKQNQRKYYNIKMNYQDRFKNKPLYSVLDECSREKNTINNQT
jgi:hypothetical protein